MGLRAAGGFLGKSRPGDLLATFGGFDRRRVLRRQPTCPFGNMLGGEILILMMLFIMPYLLAVPFYGLELLVGAIQALIFCGLTLVFVTMAVTLHEHEEAH